MFDEFMEFTRSIYGNDTPIPLHEPRFIGDEKKYLAECIDSGYVSSVGEFVKTFEARLSDYTGVNHCVATVNGTSALHIALLILGVGPETEVLTQSLTFVASTNAIRYCNASPVFLDVDRDSLSLSPASFEAFIHEKCETRDDGFCWNKGTNRKVIACLVMHTFGFPAKLSEIADICERHNISLIEDSAESLGSFYGNRHTGKFGKVSALSFNGNKIVTTGGGGMILTDDSELGRKARHLTTTARVSNRWFFEHDEVGFNYRMPNLNAALGLAQLESLNFFLKRKRDIAERYQQWGRENGLAFHREMPNTLANYWLNVAITDNIEERNRMLEITNAGGVMTRPAWIPMHELPMFSRFEKTSLQNTDWLVERLVNVPSSVAEIDVH